MRVVDYKPSTESVAYRALWGLGVVAGLFSLVVCAFMIANNLRLKTADPVHAPALQKLVQDLKTSPANDELKEQIRELDLLARRAFFTSQRFNQVAIWLLLGGLAVMVAAFKALGAYHRRVPYPDPHDARDDLVANARWARQSITVVGLLLVGLALGLALPWKSPLDQPQDLADTAPSSPAPAPAPAVLSTIPASDADTPAAATPAERLRQWPSFRGPHSAHARVQELPAQWDGASGRGVLWKTAIPLPGFNSPIVWGDRIFLSGGRRDECAVYGIDARNGVLLWSHTVSPSSGASEEVPKVTDDTGYAASTTATDGTRVFAIFATGDLMALDTQGAGLWQRSLGVPVNPYGHGSSLEIFRDTVIVQFDQKKGSFVAALDAATGETRWRTERAFGASWASPLLVEADDQAELILVADAIVSAYDPATGEERWRLKCMDSADVAPSPVWADGILYVAADYAALVAIDVASREVLWENRDEIPAVSTPVVEDGFLYGGLGEGGIVCWDARTGESRWRHDTDDGFYASPILAGHDVFLFDRSGTMHVFEATGEGYRPVAQCSLGERVVATPAVYGESLICRGETHLFRMGADKQVVTDEDTKRGLTHEGTTGSAPSREAATCSALPFASISSLQP